MFLLLCHRFHVLLFCHPVGFSHTFTWLQRTLTSVPPLPRVRRRLYPTYSTYSANLTWGYFLSQGTPQCESARLDPLSLEKKCACQYDCELKASNQKNSFEKEAPLLITKNGEKAGPPQAAGRHERSSADRATGYRIL